MSLKANVLRDWKNYKYVIMLDLQAPLLCKTCDMRLVYW